MKLIDLHIYGFGKLENVHLKLSDKIQVFYGENEAGKSTIMAFIIAVLFGFPTKQQTELRYEPKQHAKYGGMLRVQHPELGAATIERVKGKASGDVTVTLDSGLIGGEELLQQLLSNMDKGIFQAIFSFNMHGLQNIHQMKKEEIGNFLFSAGTLGTDQLSATEALLKKELDSRFKPSGRNPHLNGKLQALQELKSELKKAAGKSAHYEELIEERERIQSEKAMLQVEGAAIRQERNKLIEWEKVQPLVLESLQVEKELAEHGQVIFPLNGLEQMDKLTQLIKPYEARVISTKERIAGLMEELKNLSPDESILKDEANIVTSIEKIPLFEQLKLEKKQLEMKLDELRESLSTILEKLHVDLNDEEMLAINTNIYIKEQVEAAFKKQQQLEDAKNELDLRFSEEKESLEKVERDWNSAKEQILPENERFILEEEIGNAADIRSTEAELGAVREQIEFMKSAVQQEKNKKRNKKKQRRNQLITLGLLLMGLLLYSLLTWQPVLAVFGVTAGVVLGVFFFKGSSEEREPGLDQQVEALLQRENELMKKRSSADLIGQSALQYKLQSDKDQIERALLLQIKWEQQNEQYEKVISKFEKWECETIEHNEKLLDLTKQLRIPYHLAQKHLLVSFQWIEQFKKEFREKQRTTERIEKLDKEMQAISKNILEFTNRYLEAFEGEDLQRASLFLREKLHAERDRRVMSVEKKMKLNDLNSDLQQLETERDHLQAEANKLMEKAQANDEEHFFELGKKAEKYNLLIQKLRDVSMHLEFSFLKDEEIESFMELHNIEEFISSLSKTEQEILQRLSELQTLAASINYEIQMLEEGGVYSSLLHRYTQSKDEFEEEAKEWAVYALAQDILARTVEKYKNIHLPRMLSKAEEYLHFLTEGNYIKINLRPMGSGFLIQRKDFLTFEANELSQATTEQVYVSLRIALAMTLYEKFRFPIIIDDSFVNFDGNRMAKVIELLRQLKNNQVLFFTCHKHLLGHFQEDDILLLNEPLVKINS